MASDSPASRSRSPGLFLSRRSTSPPLGLTALAVLLGLALLGGTYFLLTQKTIRIDVDGQISTIYTHQATVGALLDELGVALAPADAISPPRDARLRNGAMIQVRRARTVLVQADGRTVELLTQARAPLDLLAEAGVRLGRYDLLRVDGEVALDPARPPAATPPSLVEVIRAVSLTINDGGRTYTIFTTEPTVGRALHAIGTTLYLADEVTPGVGTPVREGMRVTIRRSVPLVIQVDGTTVHTRTLATTVAGALAGAGLGLVGEDYSIPPPETPLPEDGVIRVVRVSEEVLIERTEVPYQTVYRPDPSMELDTQRVIQAGEPGIAERRTRIRYEDGVEVSRVVEPTRLEQPPVDEVIAYGTRIVIRTVETPDGPREYWRVVRMLATSYSPATSSKPPDAPNYGLASTGVPVEQGIVAVDPQVIPYFTRVYVPGYGTGLAADTGGAINGRRIDLGYSDDDLVLWYSWVDVYLLTPVPPEDEILYVLP